MNRFLFLAAIFSSLTAFGQGKPATTETPAAPAPATTPAPNLETCGEQIKLLCPNEKTPGEIVKCLFKNRAELSTQCKQEVERYARTQEQSSEQSGGALSALGGLSSQTPPFPLISIDGRYSPGDNSQNDINAKFSAPVYQTQQDYVAFTLTAAQMHFQEPVLLNSGREVPNDLYRVELGNQYTRKMEGFKSLSVSSSIGYAGDRIFQDARGLTFSANLRYGSPTATGGYFMWTLFISNNSSIIGPFIPIPGFLYTYKTPTFTGMFGLPFLSLQWTPAPLWAHSFSLIGTSVLVESAYGEVKSIQYFTGANWSNQSFILHDYVDSAERLIIEDKKVGIGARSFLFSKMIAEIRGGYSFDRLLYIGDGFRNMGQGSAELDAEAFATFSIKSTF
jgi:hypothetical protein